MRTAPAALVLLALLAPPLAAQADSANEPPEDAPECILEDKCPKSGVLCPEIACTIEDECPVSGVDCYSEDQDCSAEAEAGGLEYRCGRNNSAIYCERSEALPAGSTHNCHDKAQGNGLAERCVNVDFASLYCDGEEGEDEGDGSSADDSGCTVRRKRADSGVGVALAVFVAAASVTAWRARKQRRASR